MHVCAYACIQVCASACMHAGIQVCASACMHACMHLSIYLGHLRLSLDDIVKRPRPHVTRIAPSRPSRPSPHCPHCCQRLATRVPRPITDPVPSPSCCHIMRNRPVEYAFQPLSRRTFECHLARTIRGSRPSASIPRRHPRTGRKPARWRVHDALVLDAIVNLRPHTFSCSSRPTYLVAQLE